MAIPASASAVSASPRSPGCPSSSVCERHEAVIVSGRNYSRKGAPLNSGPVHPRSAFTVAPRAQALRRSDVRENLGRFGRLWVGKLLGQQGAHLPTVAMCAGVVTRRSYDHSSDRASPRGGSFSQNLTRSISSERSSAFEHGRTGTRGPPGYRPISYRANGPGESRTGSGWEPRPSDYSRKRASPGRAVRAHGETRPPRAESSQCGVTLHGVGHCSVGGSLWQRP